MVSYIIFFNQILVDFMVTFICFSKQTIIWFYCVFRVWVVEPFDGVLCMESSGSILILGGVMGDAKDFLDLEWSVGGGHGGGEEGGNGCLRFCAKGREGRELVGCGLRFGELEWRGGGSNVILREEGIMWIWLWAAWAVTMHVVLVACKDSDGSEGFPNWHGQGFILLFELLVGEEFVARTCSELGQMGDMYSV